MNELKSIHTEMDDDVGQKTLFNVTSEASTSTPNSSRHILEMALRRDSSSDFED